MKARETPRQRWERWQREGRPTGGSRMTLPAYLLESARFEAGMAFVAEAKGKPVPDGVVEELTATVADLAWVLREASR